MRSSLWRFLSALAALAALGLAPAATQAQDSDEGRTLRIGFVAFLSGPAAGSFGIPNFEGFEFMVDAINAGAVPPRMTRRASRAHRSSTSWSMNPGGQPSR